MGGLDGRASTRPALAALRQSEAFSRALLDASIDGIVAIDLHGRVLELNAAAERLFGWSRSEALGRDMAELIVPPHLRDAHRRGLERLVATGESRVLARRIEVPAQRRDGSIFEAELSIVRAPGMEPPVFVGTVRDITERKRAEAERLGLLQRDAAILGALGEIVYEWLPPQDKLHWRGDYTRILGYSASEMGADTASWTSRVHPDDLEAVLAEVEDARRESRRYDLEYRFRHRDGHYVWMHDRAELFVDARGELVRLIGIFRDVSERRRYERALAESEARFRSLSMLSSDWFWETDAEHRFVYTPPRTTQATGYGADHYVGRRRWEVQGLAPVDGDWDGHRAQLERRESFRDVELVQVRPDGSRCYLQVSGEPVFAPGGAFAGYRGTAKDITQKKSAEEALQRLSRMHAALSALNELIPRVREADVLLRRACELVAQSGSFLRAEVRMRDGAGAVAGVGSLSLPALAIPLRQAGEVVGELVVQAASAEAFQGDVRALLERMADNICFGLDYLETELRFRQTFERAGVGIAHVSLEGRFLRVNPSLCSMLGYRAEELIGRTVKDVSHPQDRDLADAATPRLRAGDTESVNVEKRYLRKDGSVVWVNLVIALARDAAGRAAYAISFVEDISARKAEERLLRLEHAVTRRLAQAGSESAGVRGVLEEICRSEGWETGRYFGVDEGAQLLRFREAWGVDDPAVRRNLEGSRARTYAMGSGLSGWVWREKKPLWVADVAQDPRASSAEESKDRLVGGALVLPVLAQERVLGVLSFSDAKARPPQERLLRALEIVAAQVGQFLEKSRADAAVRESEARFRGLVQLSSDWYWEQDEELRFTRFEGAVTEKGGNHPRAAYGRRRWELENITPLSCTWEEHRATLAARRPFRDFEYSRIGDNGRLRYVSASGEPIFDERGAFRGYRGLATDITARKSTEEALRRRERELEALVRNSPDVISRYDRELRCVFMSEAIRAVSGEAPAHYIGKRPSEFGMPRERASLWEDGLESALRGEARRIQFARPGPRGVRHFEARFAPERGASGAIDTVLAITRDVTERIEAQHTLAASEEMMRGIIHATAEPLLLVDLEGSVLYANPAAGALIGRPPAALRGQPLGLPLAAGEPAEVELLAADGTLRTAEMRVASATLPAGPSLVVSLHDLTERKRYEHHIEHLATHDGLTGLPNRTVLRDRVEQAIFHARRTSGHVALMFVDLDHFKLVNDSWGHAMGDMLLLEAAARLKRALRPGDTVARLGGDEFVVLLSDLARPGDCAQVARKVAEELAAPMELDGRSMRMSASMGIAVCPGDGEDLDSLLQCADAAMYRAKESGRGTYQYYSAEMGRQARARVELEAGLRVALEHKELRLHYQAQVDARSGEVRGMEALLRWEHPQRGMISPAEFIPVAEESGLIMPIGEWALRSACREAAGWSAAGLGEIKVAVNLSARQFWQGSVLDAVRAALEDSGLPPSRLELEITESVVARDLDQVTRSLEQLRRMGVSVAIDDFGTGYSSLGYLRSLPIQKVKIDKSFVQGIPGDSQAAALVAEIVRLAHVLSLEVVAEGVETREQADYLTAAGCEAMQGYLFSRPLPAAEAAVLLRRGRPFER